ncbi:TB2/DP1, HVA22 family-domain-containing protein [Desarmillaria tabescens]|uniref:Protein YOP1 n=1 Tax=Armillaria tabescens TaxID=1929756 RepID=A0AA39JMD3_ARMTA|nr:TB2/DP1, HVA22 family-domain-containing protein [Desarmillaria tabescens]KAK0444912.1 TB2/DP1, HVA22 family-domain-containing protein [Desarmillaria tabescens]
MSAAEKLQQHPAFKQVKTKAEYYYGQLDKELTKYPVLINLEQRTQVPKGYLVLGSAFIITFLHIFNALAAPVSNLVGWALPAYLSFKAIESPSPHDDIQWLTYWVVFGFFNFLESFALRLVLYYVPWYFAFKTLFIVWLQLPVFRGAQVTYVNILKPVLSNISSSGVVAKADNLRERAAEATE